jgi:hypothetical protein
MALSPVSLADVRQAAETLSQPGCFLAFTHGDPVLSNLVEVRGRLRLVDFEAASFGHALVEGVNPRLLFPTSGLNFVHRIPKVVWRHAESAYRSLLAEHCPQATDDTVFGSAVAAACTRWTLAFCQRWLDLALHSDGPRVARLRQVVLTRLELFVQTTEEFHSLCALGEAFAAFLADLRSQWSQDLDVLSSYPAFQHGG